MVKFMNLLTGRREYDGEDKMQRWTWIDEK
jgi:hypothetical protein